jgi:hypothetical protein
MFEVKIYDAKGKLKKIIPADKVSKNHWKNFTHLSGNSSIALRTKNNAKAKLAEQRKRDAGEKECKE